jgi:hypothetical protein
MRAPSRRSRRRVSRKARPVECSVSRRHAKGQVLEELAEPDAQQLCEAGWLERRTVDANGDTAYFWSPQAETALDMNALRRDQPADLN